MQVRNGALSTQTQVDSGLSTSISFVPQSGSPDPSPSHRPMVPLKHGARVPIRSHGPVSRLADFGLSITTLA